MLSENIRRIRKSKGLSQEELAVRLNVVRQTVSKWEQGLSVPDSDMLIAVSRELGTTVAVLLGESVACADTTDTAELAEKLEAINAEFARRKLLQRRVFFCIFAVICVATVMIFAALAILKSPYLGWNTGDPETAVFAAGFHLFEFVFVRVAPFLFVGSLIGVILTCKKGIM